MNAPIDISYDEFPRSLATARKLRSEAWTGWIYAAATAAARVARIAVALAMEMIEAGPRARRRRATIRALSGLSDHVLQDIGLSRASIYLIANEVAASSRRTWPGHVVAGRARL